MTNITQILSRIELGDPAATAEFEHVIFDTAPTGHTLRLLTLPSAWEGFLQENTTGTSCLGPLAGLQAQQALYRDTVQALRDPERTTLVLVTCAEPSALREADRTSHELAALEVSNQRLVVNGIFEASDTSDPVAVAMARRHADALENIPTNLSALPQIRVSLAPHGMLGIESLRALARGDHSPPVARTTPDAPPLPGLESLLDELGSSCGMRTQAFGMEPHQLAT